jgi:hypothetical protein
LEGIFDSSSAPVTSARATCVLGAVAMPSPPAAVAAMRYALSQGRRAISIAARRAPPLAPEKDDLLTYAYPNSSGRKTVRMGGTIPICRCKALSGSSRPDETMDD